MFIRNQRFSFWRVFWGVLISSCLFLLLGLIATLTASSSSKEPYNWKNIINTWHLVNQGINVVYAAVYFYFCLNFYHRYMVEKKNFLYYLRVAVLATASCALYQFVKDKWVPGSENTRLNRGMVLFVFTISNLFYTALALLIAYLTYLRDEKKQRKILEEQKMQLEVEKSSANLNFLKAQINPHFLHNTLNFLYAKSLPYSPELSEGILTLSDIMRYALSEGNARDGKAPLKDEIEHVWNVIKINQLRFSNKLNVEFVVTGLVNGVTIIPFVLITIVENAFKHGISLRERSWINLSMRFDGRQLYFDIHNSLHVRQQAGTEDSQAGPKEER